MRSGCYLKLRGWRPHSYDAVLILYRSLKVQVPRVFSSSDNSDREGPGIEGPSCVTLRMYEREGDRERDRERQTGSKEQEREIDHACRYKGHGVSCLFFHVGAGACMVCPQRRRTTNRAAPKDPQSLCNTIGDVRFR